MARSLEVGDVLGRHRILEQLGSGGMAVVFRAEDTVLGRQVAIKVMHPHLWGKPEYAERFTREARAVARLHHPNIVEIFDFGEGQAGAEGQEELPGFIVSELVEGPTLKAFVDRHGTPLSEVAAMIALELSAALGAAHEQGIIHRDLKPENVMLAGAGRVVLTDFGIARVVEGEAMTQTGAMVGSPAFMSPEQARGRAIDARSDLFSLGTVLYLLCTGKLPFSGRDPISTVLKVLDGAYEPPQKLNPRIGDGLARIIQRLLRVDPEQRFGSARELSAALSRVLSEAGIEHPAQDLQRYFEGPGDYNTALVTRVIERSMVLAREARTGGDSTRALSLCSRVLAFEPEHAGAVELVQGLGHGGAGQRRWVLGGAALLVLAAMGVGAWWALSPEPAPRRSPRRRPPVKAAGPARAPLPDAEPSPDLLARPDTRASDAGPDSTGAAQRPRPRPLAPGTPAVTPDAAPPAKPPPLKPDAAPARARLKLSIGPHCEATLDGRPVGRSPLTEPLVVSPGKHQVSCRFPGGLLLRREVTLRPGELRELRDTPRVVVRLSLKRGDAVRIDRKLHRSGQRLAAPRRYRVDVLRDGEQVLGGWVMIPTRDCTLVDTPDLTCR